MRLKDAREFYYFYSGKTSDVVRQLALAGLAVIWLFKVDVNGVPKVPEDLLQPLALIVLGLTFDVLQYAIATTVWGIFQRRKERGGAKDDEDFLAPRWINWPAISLIILKVFAIGCAYLLLLKYVAGVIRA